MTCLGVFGDGAEPGPQVVVDVGGEIGDPVIEHLLPQCGLLERVGGLLLAPLKLIGQPAGLIGIVERGQFGIDGQTEMLCRRGDFGEHMVADPVVLPGEHLLGQERTIAGKLDSSLSSLSLVGDGVAAQQRGHRDHRQIQSGAAQVCGVGVDDLAPERVQVGLGGDDRRRPGRSRSACRRNRISAAVNSWLASLTNSMASASGNSPRVADRCGWP